jgi:hypothetical protein
MVRLLRILELLSLLLLHILGQAVPVSLEMWHGGERELGKHGWSPHVTQKLNASRGLVCAITVCIIRPGLEPVISQCLCLKGDHLPH